MPSKQWVRGSNPLGIANFKETNMDDTILKVIDIEEHQDGSAKVTFEFSDKTRQMLISEGLLSILQKAVEEKDV